MQVEHPDTLEVERFSFRDICEQRCDFPHAIGSISETVGKVDEHALVLSYGKKGTGKTFALLDDEGIIHNVLPRIFEHKAAEDKVECVALEIYGEEVIDLLSLAGEGAGAKVKKATSVKSLISDSSASDSTRVLLSSMEDFLSVVRAVQFSRITSPVKSYRPHLIFHFALKEGANSFTFVDTGCRDMASTRSLDHQTESYDSIYEGLGATVLPLQTCALLKRMLPYPTKTLFLLNISTQKIHYEDTVQGLRIAKHLEKTLRGVHKGSAGIKSQLQKRLATPIPGEQLRAELQKLVAGLGLAFWDSEQENPMLRVLHPDAMLSGVLAYVVEEGSSVVSREDAGTGSLKMLGVDILPKHCEFRWSGSKSELSVKVYKGARITVGERTIEEASTIELSHNDCILVGDYVCCQVYLPQEPVPKRLGSWHDSINQLVSNDVEEIEKCTRDLLNKASTESKILADDPAKSTAFVLRKLRIENRQIALKEELGLLTYLVNMINQSCEECAMDMRYKISKREYCYANQTRTHALMVQIINKVDEEVLCYLSVKGFHDRYVKIFQAKDSDSKQELIYSPERDSELLLGESTLYLEPLSYLLHIEEEVPILNYKGDVKGTLSVLVKVAKIDGEVCQTKDDTINTPRDALAANPSETISSHRKKSLEFCVEIRQAAGLPSNLKWIRVKCVLAFGDILYSIESNKIDEDVVRAQINSKHNIDVVVTDDLISWFESDAIEFQVWCHPFPSDASNRSIAVDGHEERSKNDSSVKALEAQNKKLEAEVRRLTRTIAKNETNPKPKASKACEVL